MEDLVASQYELHGRIARTWDNLKKSGPAQKITVDLVRSTMALLDAKWQKYDSQHSELMRSHRKELKGSSYVTEDLYEKTEAQYASQRAQLLAAERQLAPAVPSEASASSASAPPSTGSSVPAPAPAPSLPRIELPKFSGKFEDWPAFRDLFTSMVRHEAALPDVKKFHYLKTSVQGEAESLLKNLPTTGDNFNRAWKILQDHFENKRLLVRAYLNSFTALPKMRPNHAGDLRQIFHGIMTTAGALESVGRPITSSEDLFVHLAVNLLDPAARREWDKTLTKTSTPPSFEDLRSFLQEQLTSEEALKPDERETSRRQSSRSGRTVCVAQQTSKGSKPGRLCPMCNGAHFLGHCEQFLRRGPTERREVVAKHNRCVNCLGRHAVSTCVVTKTCLKCAGKHHTSLHDAFTTATTSEASIHLAEQALTEHAAVLLATVRVWATDSMGREHSVRALLDPGSETSLIAESLAQRLRLRRTPASVAIYGVGGQRSGVARGRTTLTLSASNRECSITTSALILPRLSSYGSSQAVRSRSWPHVTDLQLADPEFLARDPVEVLLGVDVYASIVMPGLRRGGPLDPVAQQTRLGWVLLGGIGGAPRNSAEASIHCSSNDDIAQALRRFWEWEEPQSFTAPPTEEEQQGEAHFLATYQRLQSGRFQVRLPFRTSATTRLASTKVAAKRMLQAMDRRFARDEFFGRLYEDFMAEYQDLHHMCPAPELPNGDPERVCYLPHHGVVKESGGHCKLRVVFNGSAKSLEGPSLNEQLLTGANLMPFLPDLLLRWRRYQFAFVADVEKMYRQIQVHPSDRDLQRILWKRNGQVTEFRLNTLTYGTACAPFLAMRVLKQLAQDEEARFPAGAATIREDSYVDDILSGASTLEEGVQKQQELSALCMAGGFPLRKWAANHSGLLVGLSPDYEHIQSASTVLPMQEHSVLGLRWFPDADQLSIVVDAAPSGVPTKRAVLSQVARLFDPLGWLAPVIIRAKILIQNAWLQQLDWDQPLAPSEAAAWKRLVQELTTMEEIRIPRWIKGFARRSQLEIHGFADASERAYGAVVYLRVEEAGEVHVTLLQSKSKVAPLKQISLPRLELCAAAMLSKLVAHLRKVLDLGSVPAHLWSDSAVTLAWLRGHPSKWTTFVANRVAEIQRENHLAQWRHVPGSENPADCVSRGLFPGELAKHSLWWTGPSFLRGNPELWPVPDKPLPMEGQPEQRKVQCLIVKQDHAEPPELTRFSDLRRLLRVTAWIRRWTSRLAKPSRHQDGPYKSVLHPQELEEALMLWIRVSQSIAFGPELRNIHAGRAVPPQSPLKTLTPFLDRDGVLRVGGRLKHSLLDADQQHPIILASASHLSRLVVQEQHLRTLHGGTQVTLAAIRQRFWLLRGRQLVKHWIRQCPKCLRWRATTPQPIMGDLPAARVWPSRPFLHTGVDYAGPVRLRTSRGRGQRSYKAFLCIFICFSTRAVHLEVASDYTAAAFLAAFRRFTSRRGLPTVMHSDRGTNFVGADRELRALFSDACEESRIIAASLADKGIRWAFNPPAAPHFGGLWEAAVRSVKHHIRRVIGDARLTFEEMSTLLAEVEACLNSRPLQAMSDDPEDIAALTPGHFLVGEPLLSIPEPSLISVPANRLSRWRLVQKMRDHLWVRWAREYLQSLLPRPKWWRETGGVKEGQLCIIREEGTPPSRWPLARVVRLHQGPDGRVRVVDLKTASGLLTRPVVKIVPLPAAAATVSQ